MSEIRVQCIDQAISFLNTPVISSGNVNYDRIVFDFCSRWDGYAKTAIFYRNKDEVYYQLLENDSCLIPNEVLGDKGIIYLGVFGTQGDKTITSQVLTYRIQEGAVTEDLKPSDPTPDIYEQIVSRYNDYDTRLAYFENRFNGSVGDAEKLGGQLPEYYATAQSVSNIQTTSKGILSTAGWYRVAEYSGGSESALNGSNGNSCGIFIKCGYGSIPTSVYYLLLKSRYTNQEFSQVMGASGGTRAITKIRYVYDKATVKAYLEIYYSANVSNGVTVIFDHVEDRLVAWQAITPTLTEETVDGVTVTTTYDIPANARPVTDLDLVRFSGKGEILTTSVLDKALEVELGVHQYSNLGGSSHGTDDMPNAQYRYSSATIYKRSDADILIVLWGRRGYKPQINYYDGTSWLGWNELSTTADLTTALASYLPLDGSKDMKGNVVIRSNSATDLDFRLVNSVRGIRHLLNSAGSYYLLDATNAKNIIASSPDGTNTFYGTSTGNLPLTGGTLTGKVYLGNADTTDIGLRIQTANRDIYLYNYDNGRFALRDNTNVKDIISSTKDGTTTFNGTASGNLPLTSSSTQIIKTTGLAFDNVTSGATGDTSGAQLAFRVNGEAVGALGIHKKVPVYYGNGAYQTLHHDGNSAKVVVSSTPLTASGSIRVW